MAKIWTREFVHEVRGLALGLMPDVAKDPSSVRWETTWDKIVETMDALWDVAEAARAHMREPIGYKDLAAALARLPWPKEER